jgi:hypothetical protein
MKYSHGKDENQNSDTKRDPLNSDRSLAYPDQRMNNIFDFSCEVSNSDDLPSSVSLTPSFELSSSLGIPSTSVSSTLLSYHPEDHEFIQNAESHTSLQSPCSISNNDDNDIHTETLFKSNDISIFAVNSEVAKTFEDLPESTRAEILQFFISGQHFNKLI